MTIPNTCVNAQEAEKLTIEHDFICHLYQWGNTESTYTILLEQRRLILADKRQRRAKYMIRAEDVLALLLVPVEARQVFVESVATL